MAICGVWLVNVRWTILGFCQAEVEIFWIQSRGCCWAALVEKMRGMVRDIGRRCIREVRRSAKVVVQLEFRASAGDMLQYSISVLSQRVHCALGDRLALDSGHNRTVKWHQYTIRLFGIHPRLV